MDIAFAVVYPDTTRAIVPPERQKEKPFGAARLWPGVILGVYSKNKVALRAFSDF